MQRSAAKVFGYPMTIVALALLCCVFVTVVVLGYFFFAGKYNTLITLRKHAWQACIDLTSADLRFADKLRNQGFETEADLIEEAAHYAVAVFGQPSAHEDLSSARQHAQTRKPDYREHAELTSDYKAKVDFYNSKLRDPFCALLAKGCALRRLSR